jgi:hypothetical protein
MAHYVSNIAAQHLHVLPPCPQCCFVLMAVTCHIISVKADQDQSFILKSQQGQELRMNHGSQA